MMDLGQDKRRREKRRRTIRFEVRIWYGTSSSRTKLIGNLIDQSPSGAKIEIEDFGASRFNLEWLVGQNVWIFTPSEAMWREAAVRWAGPSGLGVAYVGRPRMLPPHFLRDAVEARPRK